MKSRHNCKKLFEGVNYILFFGFSFYAHRAHTNLLMDTKGTPDALNYRYHLSGFEHLWQSGMRLCRDIHSSKEMMCVNGSETMGCFIYL